MKKFITPVAVLEEIEEKDILTLSDGNGGQVPGGNGGNFNGNDFGFGN